MALPAYAMNVGSFPEMYEQLLVAPLFRPWAELILDEVSPAAGDRVLDIACGTGIVARLARARAGAEAKVVGVDLSPQMLEVSRRVAPDIDWREGNAEALPLAEGEQFDAVFCQHGLQFVPDRQAAAREMRRALAPRGRLAVATWRSLAENPFFRDLNGVAERHLGPIVDQRHAFGDGAALERLLRDTGFRDVQVKGVARTVRFDEGAVIVRMNTMALVGMSARGKTMSDEERGRAIAAIVEESMAAAAPYSDGPAVSFELCSNIATARA